MVESNSDVHFWLRNCSIDRVIFSNFRFSDRLVSELCALKPRSLSINNCIFVYTKPCIEKRRRSPLITDNQLRQLFSAHAFLQCTGAIFCFRKYTASYRPPLSLLLSLPPSTLVIDFEEYVCQDDDLKLLADWLHDENVQQDQVTSFGISKQRTKSLSIKGIEFEGNHFNDFVDILRKKFLYDTRPHAYIFETDFDPETDYDVKMENETTQEKFVVFYDFETQAYIQRHK